MGRPWRETVRFEGLENLHRAIDKKRELTRLGRTLSTVALDPRLGRMGPGRDAAQAQINAVAELGGLGVSADGTITPDMLISLP